MNRPALRPASVTGTFYPDSKQAVLENLSMFLRGLSAPSAKPKAIVVPHAGWKYCGSVSAKAWNETRELHPQRVLLLGPSHRVPVRGWALDPSDAWETPLGKVPIDLDFREQLASLCPGWHLQHEPHRVEHSLEVIVPWIQHLFPGISIVPAVGNEAFQPEALDAFASLLTDDALLVISTDLSHFHHQAAATSMDQNFLDHLLKNQIETASWESACGLAGLQMLSALAVRKKWRPKLLDYQTSAKASGDFSRVVGYASLAYYGDQT